MAEIGQEVYFINACLRSGIQKRTITSFSRFRKDLVHLNGSKSFYVLNKDVFENETEARIAAEELKNQEIISLTKRIAKLSKLRFVQEDIGHLQLWRVDNQNLILLKYETYDNYAFLHTRHRESGLENLLVYEILRHPQNNKIYQASPRNLKDLPRHAILFTKRTFPSVNIL